LEIFFVQLTQNFLLPPHPKPEKQNYRDNYGGDANPGFGVFAQWHTFKPY
jgi:hypothetical protein